MGSASAGLGERRRSGSAYEQIRGDERIGHLGSEEGVGFVPRSQIGGQRLAAFQSVGISGLTRHVQHVRRLDQLGDCLGDGAIESPHRPGTAEDKEDWQLVLQAAVRRAVALSRPEKERIGVPVT